MTSTNTALITVLAGLFAATALAAPAEGQSRDARPGGSFLGEYCAGDPDPRPEVCEEQARAQGVELIYTDFRVTADAILRAGPSVETEALGSVRRRQRLSPVGRVMDENGEPWLLISNRSQTYYLKEELAEPEG
jgi:hypothetical protein